MAGRTGLQESVFVKKRLAMCYLRTDTGVYIDMYRDRITGRVWWSCSEKRSEETLEKKQTDRDDVRRAYTRHVQIEKGSP